ncbi:hypothetical protein FRB94_003763 [Tulasnella sp. JGI-2019a]|nr:hypothetical protein FRB93_012200 [Tulasnella sp. JGI-2019a]KAG9002615.1 hypothetical protein FRB94_003763 [Tulasnella sp. JGI-2019a]KAG9031552.1 hypothetical protein FRB95_002546 [Tulasnella sp. JGI-2019a]
MVEDKYVGLALAVTSSVAIGTSFIITKKGLIDAASRNSAYENASDDRAYLWNPIWWAGMVMLILGEVANFAAYTFAPPILVTPLGALTVLIGAVLASIMLGEELGHIGRLGCTLALIGSLIIVLHAPEDKPVQTVDEILNYAIQPAFMFYCFIVLIFTIVMIIAVAPKYGKKNPLVYLSICSTVGSITVMSVKGFGIALKLTLAGNNQFSHPSTYVFLIVVVVCIMTQMNYFNKALDLFSTNVVNPLYYVGFTTCTIVASLILFQGFYNTSVSNSVSLIVGFVVIFIGVHLLNLPHAPNEGGPPPSGHHLPMENGFANPRLSLGGRLSLDSSWSGERFQSPTHARRSRRDSNGTSFPYRNIGDEEAGMANGVRLSKLSEDPREADAYSEDDELEAITESTSLRTKRSRNNGRPNGGKGSAPSTPAVELPR